MRLSHSTCALIRWRRAAIFGSAQPYGSSSVGRASKVLCFYSCSAMLCCSSRRMIRARRLSVVFGRMPCSVFQCRHRRRAGRESAQANVHSQTFLPTQYPRDCKCGSCNSFFGLRPPLDCQGSTKSSTPLQADAFYLL